MKPSKSPFLWDGGQLLPRCRLDGCYRDVTVTLAQGRLLLCRWQLLGSLRLLVHTPQ